MVAIVWKFRVRQGRERDFELHYGSEGTWVKLFRRSTQYVATELLRDREAPRTYVTVDRWQSLETYEKFHQEFAGEYKRIDGEMEDLTEEETRVGVYEVV